MKAHDRAPVVVVGSINVDVSVTTGRIPGRGRRCSPTTFGEAEVARGANQAVAAARAGDVPTTMIDVAGTDDLKDAVTILITRVPKVLVTLGRGGSMLTARDGVVVRVETPEVVALDTTSAGDTYCGVLVAALAAGASDHQAMQRASAAASLAVERVGAQDSIPSAVETDSRFADAYGRKETR